MQLLLMTSLCLALALTPAVQDDKHGEKHFIEGQGKEFLSLTADAKLYEVVQSLKHEYGGELNGSYRSLVTGICSRTSR